MSKFLKNAVNVTALLILAVLAIYSPKGFTQSPPLILCNGGYIPQGTPCGGVGGGTAIPVGQIMQAGSGLGKCELVGGVAGGVAGAVIGGKDHRGLGAILGALAGGFAGNKYCENSAGQVVAVADQTQQVVQQRRCAPGMVWAKLDWKGVNGQPDHPQHGAMVCMKPDDPHRAQGS